MEKLELEKYGNLPRGVRQSLLATEDQPSELEPKQSDPSVNEEGNDPNIEQGSDKDYQDDKPTSTNPNSNQPKQSKSQTPTKPNLTEDQDYDNNAKSWKGRLNKEQKAKKELENKYLEEVRAREKYEAELQEQRERLARLEEELGTRDVQPPVTKQSSGQYQAQKPEQAQPDDLDFTDEEREEIELLLGDKLAEKLLRRKPSQDVNQIIDQRFAEQQRRLEQADRANVFYTELQKTVPEIQGLLTDDDFGEFLNNKIVDFAGNNASSFLGFVGQSQDVSLLPKVRELVDEFKQSIEPSGVNATVPPSNQSSASNKRQPNGKKRVTEAVRSKIQYLINTGQVEALRELQEKYDI